MLRSIDLEIDTSSWGTSNVPTKIAALVGSRTTDVLVALIHTALWTRPPRIYGFHLSDRWAWLRYHSAIADSYDLRLRYKWGDIDPHQKTILSDELSIGFTTQLLIEKLGCKGFADTLYVVNVLNSKKFQLNKLSRNGQNKSPDYIGYDTKSDYYILECKGTQVSKKKLKHLVNRGKQQKSNLKAVGKTRIRYSLVAGFFIPQSHNQMKSCIYIADPSWEELNEFLSRYTTNQINAAILQITLAKYFSLIGLNNVSRSLAETPTEELQQLPDDARFSLNDWLTEASGEFRTIFDTTSIYPSLTTSSNVFPRGRFLVRTPEEILGRLIDSQSVENLLNDLSISLLSNTWQVESEDSNEMIAQISSPLEFQFRLEFV